MFMFFFVVLGLMTLFFLIFGLWLMNIKKECFFVYWLSFKDGRKKLCETIFENRCSAERAALYAMTFYDGQDVLSSDYPFYIGCYEY